MNLNILRKITHFSELNDEELKSIYKFCSIKKFNKNDIIFFESEPYKGFYAVLSGLVKVFKVSPEGKEQIINIFEPFGTFAEVPMFKNINSPDSNLSYPANSASLEDDTELLFIPAKEYINFIKSDINLCLKMISVLSLKNVHLNMMLGNITLKDVSKRLAEFLLSEIEKSNQNTATIKLDITRYDLAAYLGTVQETISRTLKRLQNDGIIEVSGKDIFIKDISKLKNLSE
ncbi:MAG TPA: Crp/Fnr family transcriptional regulator [Ignavibacteria bacterium]|nr:Crp/Fnr family transcriptional regulator [Ignavibacteria bacterium]